MNKLALEHRQRLERQELMLRKNPHEILMAALTHAGHHEMFRVTLILLQNRLTTSGGALK
jgi:hypothetical protein